MLDAQVKQGFGVQRALKAGLEHGMQWLIQSDPDELLYPQKESFNIAAGALIPTTARISSPRPLREIGGDHCSRWLAVSAVLAYQPAHVSAVRFLNYEGQPEAVDLVNRFEQVPSQGAPTQIVSEATGMHASGS